MFWGYPLGDAVQSGDGALVSWRLLGGDTMDAAFHVYRDDTLLTPEPLTGATTPLDEDAHSGHTGPVLLDACTLDGDRLWRVDLGPNVRAGAHYTQFQVYDYDADGAAELAVKTADGTGLWNTDQGHGDALHVGDFLPEHDGLEVYGVGENSDRADAWIADAATGEIIWESEATTDNGRGVAADVWPGDPGAEFWSSAVDGMRNGSGDDVGREPGSTNFLAWWDGDTSRELLDGNAIDKYGPDGDECLLIGEDVASDNGTKSTPVLSGDILGDWREEVVWRTEDNSALRVYSTPHETEERMPTLVHDTQYRVAPAWQNTAYNQPAHPSFARR